MSGLSNLEFLKKYAKRGCVGLMGGSSAIDRAIRHGQRNLDGDGKPSLWSHAVLFQGDRVDGASWLIESDFEVGRGSLRNGVQENRIAKETTSRQRRFRASLADARRSPRPRTGTIPTKAC